MIKLNPQGDVEAFRDDEPDSEQREVGEAERLASIALGAGLVVASITSFARGKSIRGLILGAAGGALATRGVTGRCAIYRNLGIEADDAGAMSGPLSRFVHIRRAVTINATAEDLYNRWRNFEKLSDILTHIKSVQTLEDGRSRWVAEGPLGATAEWTATIERDEPGRIIAWRSEPGSAVQTRGKVEFIPARAGRGAVVRVDLAYHPPGGALGAAAARLFRNDPDREVRDDLRRFKQVVETGEITTNAGPSGRDIHSDGRPPRRSTRGGLSGRRAGAEITARAGRAPDPVEEASIGSFPASDPPPY